MPEHEVAKLSEIPVGKMKHVKAFDEDILLSNVGGTILRNLEQVRASKRFSGKGYTKWSRGHLPASCSYF